MTNQPPDTIYLQYYGDAWYIDNIEKPEPAEGDEVTWCVEKINEVDIKYLLATPQREAAPELFEACSFPGDYGVLLNLAADIIEDIGHERQQGIATRLREKAKLERAALELATGDSDE